MAAYAETPTRHDEVGGYRLMRVTRRTLQRKMSQLSREKSGNSSRRVFVER